MKIESRWTCGLLVGALCLAGGSLWSGEGPGAHKREGSAPTGRPQRSAKESPALALGGACPVCLVEMGKTVPGKEEFSSVYKGVEYRFPSKEQQKIFDANPRKYALQDGGNCPVCKVDIKKTVKGDPAIYAVHNGKIYAFVNRETKEAFEANPAKYTDEESAVKRPSEGSHHREGSGR